MFVRTHISLNNREFILTFYFGGRSGSLVDTVPILMKECSSPRGCLEIYGFLLLESKVYVLTINQKEGLLLSTLLQTTSSLSTL